MRLLHIDAIGNIVDVFIAASPHTRALHYDVIMAMVSPGHRNVLALLPLSHGTIGQYGQSLTGILLHGT